MNVSIRALAVAFGFTAALSAASLPAQEAQTAPDTIPQTEPEATASSYDDQKLTSFVDAALGVAEVRRDYAQRIEAAEDETAARELAQQASTEMRETVEQTEGITVDEYVEIGEAAQSDPALAERITMMVQERQPQPQDGG